MTWYINKHLSTIQEVIMNKYFLVILLHFFCVFFIYAQIEAITNISNPQRYFSYGLYQGTFVSYEDRIIVTEFYTNSEYRVLPNGELEFISYFEPTYHGSFKVDNLYIIPNVTFDSTYPLRHSIGFFVYDLSQSPVEFVTHVELRDVIIDVNLHSRYNFFFNDKHIMVACQFRNQTVLVCRETFKIDGLIPGLAGGFLEFYNDTIIHLTIIGSYYRLRLLSINEDNTINEISSLDITGFRPINGHQINVVDSKVIIVTWDDLVFIDISDVKNPFVSIQFDRDLYPLNIQKLTYMVLMKT